MSKLPRRVAKEFDPSQPRDDDGKWADGGGGGGNLTPNAGSALDRQIADTARIESDLRAGRITRAEAQAQISASASRGTIGRSLLPGASAAITAVLNSEAQSIAASARGKRRGAQRV